VRAFAGNGILPLFAAGAEGVCDRQLQSPHPRVAPSQDISIWFDRMTALMIKVAFSNGLSINFSNSIVSHVRRGL
jgi:hypothetical protein